MGGWCIKFDQDVLSTGQFTGYAKSKLVLVRLDFRPPQRAGRRTEQANEPTVAAVRREWFSHLRAVEFRRQGNSSSGRLLEGRAGCLYRELDRFGR